MPKMATIAEMVIWLGLIFLIVIGSERLEWLGCPNDAFICGSASAGTHTWSGFARLVLLLACAAYPAKIGAYFATRNHIMRKSFDQENKHFDLRSASVRSLLIAALILPIIYLLTVEKIWASSTEIAEREYVWTTVVKRKWKDVVAVSTSCTPGARGSWNQSYYLNFRDGSHVDLAFNAGRIAEHKTEIYAALHGRSFAFDSSAVDQNCISEFREMAVRRP